MFCTESCEHGLNAASTGKLLGSSQTAGQQQQPILPQQPQPQPQCHMGCPSLPISMPTMADMEPPKVGMCFVTEGPEGLSIDCNVPIPSSFNLEEYKKQLSCCPPLPPSSHYFDHFGLPPPPPTPSSPPHPPSGQHSQTLGGELSSNLAPLANCSCQCCQCAYPCLSCYEQVASTSTSSPAAGGSQSTKNPSKSSKQDRNVTVASSQQQQQQLLTNSLHQPATSTMMPPYFCVATAAGAVPLPQMDCACLMGPPIQTENGSAYFCGMIPTTNPATSQQQQLQQLMPPHSCHFQAIGLMPLQQQQQQLQYQSHHLHLQQQQQQQQQQMLLSSTGQQESQQPLSPQLVRLDFPLPCLLTEFRRDKDKSCCEQPLPSIINSLPPNLAFQLYAPMPAMTVCDSSGSKHITSNPEQPDSTSSRVVTITDPETSDTSVAPEQASVAATTATTSTTTTSGKRSCLRNKDTWNTNSPGQIQNSYASPPLQQCGPGNVCMKCGWHCPRCSNCYWHPGALRQSADKRR